MLTPNNISLLLRHGSFFIRFVDGSSLLLLLAIIPLVCCKAITGSTLIGTAPTLRGGWTLPGSGKLAGAVWLGREEKYELLSAWRIRIHNYWKKYRKHIYEKALSVNLTCFAVHLLLGFNLSIDISKSLVSCVWLLFHIISTVTIILFLYIYFLYMKYWRTQIKEPCLKAGEAQTEWN